MSPQNLNSTDTANLTPNTINRSNTATTPDHSVYQTLYSPQHCQTTTYSLANGLLTDTTTHTPIAVQALTQAKEGETNWLHYVGINNAQTLHNLLQPYGIHELVIEDILNSQQRPKIDNYGDYVFICTRVYQY